MLSKARGAGALFQRRPVQQATMALMFLVFATCGCIESVCSGLIIDDATEQKTFRTITAAAYSLLHGDIAGFDQLASYDQRYYGIGFYLIAYPLQAAIRPVLAGHFQIDNETALLLARRPVCFCSSPSRRSSSIAVSAFRYATSLFAQFSPLLLRCTRTFSDTQ